jgi:uncharacterized MnhB-related membrane protein
MVELLLVIAAIFCAFQVMRSPRLLLSTLWLAITSALVALLIYQLGAPEVAVIELSVGAGLVTVLFVFAFSIIGEHTMDDISIVPRPLVWVLVLLVSFLLGWFALPLVDQSKVIINVAFARVMWDSRGLDVLAQMVLIFAGVMGLMGLLADVRTPARSRQSQPLQVLTDREVTSVPDIFIPEGNYEEPALPMEEMHR